MVTIKARWQSLPKDLNGILELYFASPLRICSQVFGTSLQMDRRKNVLLDRRLKENGQEWSSESAEAMLHSSLR